MEIHDITEDNDLSTGEKLKPLPSMNTPKHSDFHERLNLLISKHKNPHSFAKTCGISQSGLIRLVSGGLPTLSVLIAIAKANNVSIEWLATGDGDMVKNSKEIPKEQAIHSNQNIVTLNGNIINLDKIHFITQYQLNKKHNEIIDPDSEPQLAIHQNFLNNILKVSASDLAIIEVKGDSMLGEINDKDIVLINTSDTSLHDGIYVLRINGDIIIKRVQKLLNGIVSIASANPVYQALEIDINRPPNDFSVIGRVVWFGRTVP